MYRDNGACTNTLSKRLIQFVNWIKYVWELWKFVDVPNFVSRTAPPSMLLLVDGLILFEKEKNDEAKDILFFILLEFILCA